MGKERGEGEEGREWKGKGEEGRKERKSWGGGEKRRKRRKERIVCGKKDGFFIWMFLKVIFG